MAVKYVLIFIAGLRVYAIWDTVPERIAELLAAYSCLSMHWCDFFIRQSFWASLFLTTPTYVTCDRYEALSTGSNGPLNKTTRCPTDFYTLHSSTLCIKRTSHSRKPLNMAERVHCFCEPTFNDLGGFANIYLILEPTRRFLLVRWSRIWHH